MIAHGNAAFESREQTGGMAPLPAGVYIGQIIGAKVEPNNFGGQNLIVQVEITEGEYAGYYRRQFESQNGGQFGRRYKGVLRQRVPVYDSNGRPATEGDDFANKALQHLAWALEQSNEGYRWDWDETRLKGKACAFSVRERDWFMEAAEEERGYRSGTTTEVWRLESLPAAKAGKVRTPKKRELRQQDLDKKAELDARFASGQPSPAAAAMVVNPDLPF